MKRRLAAILAADVVGYSRLMGQNETGTLAALKALRTELIDSKITGREGQHLQLCHPLHIGINVGDVVIEEGDIFGDGEVRQSSRAIILARRASWRVL
jgi:class 3 adenylate cyclase